jgi:hypothetical protein
MPHIISCGIVLKFKYLYNKNPNHIITPGEKEKLEQKLYESSPGLGDAAPPQFFVG